jgi:cytochrome c oxidase subunit IV
MQQATMLLLPSLNETFDIASTRAMILQIHPPKIIFALLFVLAIASALLAGFDMTGRGRPSWLHIIGFAATMALALYVILDLEYPRIGLIRVDDFDRNLVELRASMD